MVAPPAVSPVNLQMMQSQFSSAASVAPMSNMSMLNASTSSMDPMVNQLMLTTQPASSSALQLASNVRPYVPRSVSNPMLSHWPPATDNSLPKEGWFLLNELWVQLPMNYLYDVAEVPASINCSLMQGCFEVPWQQNPTIFVLLEFQYLRIYDSQGPIQVLDNTEIKDPALPKPIKFDFNILNAVMMRFRTVAARSPSRMRSISELTVREYVQGKEADQKVLQLTAAYLSSVVENPDSLAVDSSYWQQLADIIATADCLQYVHRVRLFKISERVAGLTADIHLNQAVVSADRFLPESELY